MEAVYTLASECWGVSALPETVDRLIEEPFPAPIPEESGHHLSIGRTGESLACKYLWKKGLRIIGTNVVTLAGEIDIICEKRGRIHFVEVKSRAYDSQGDPELRVDYKKRRRLRQAARAYLQDFHEAPLEGTQFDIVSVVLDKNETGARDIRWIQEAF